mgnify:CR=1 FL=1
MRIYMQTPVHNDRPPRFYQLFVQKDLIGGWTLVKEWGAQGSPGRVVREHFDRREHAEQALLRTRDAQLQKGYRVMFTKGQERP